MNERQDLLNNDQPLAPDDIIQAVHDVTRNIDPLILGRNKDDISVNTYQGLEDDQLKFIAAMHKFDGAEKITEGLRAEYQIASKTGNFDSLKTHILMLMRMADEVSGTIFIPVIYGWRSKKSVLMIPPGYLPLEQSELAVIKPIFLEVCDQLDISIPSLKRSHAGETERNRWMPIFVEYPVMQIYMALKNPDSVESTRLAKMLDRAVRVQEFVDEARRNPPRTDSHLSFTSHMLLWLSSASANGTLLYHTFFNGGDLWLALAWFFLFLLSVSILQQVDWDNPRKTAKRFSDTKDTLLAIIPATMTGFFFYYAFFDGMRLVEGVVLFFLLPLVFVMVYLHVFWLEHLFRDK